MHATAFPTTATTLPDLSRDAAQHLPDHDAYVELDQRVTYGDYDRAADGLASLFSDWGVGRGDVVCLSLPSSIDYAICYQAALRLGALTSGVNTRLGRAEQRSILTRSAPKVTVIPDGAPPPGPSGRVLERSSLAAAFALDPDYPRPALSPDDPVAIVWTSGTTGDPKGAVYDHARLAAMAAGAGPMSRPGDRRIYPLPFAHTGYMTRLWDEISNGIACIITPPAWTAEVALRMIDRERVTVGQGVATQWELMLRHPMFDSTDFSPMRIAALGASSIPADLVRRVRDRVGCPVVVRYTSTEACITTSTSPGDPPEVVATTVGRPIEGVEVVLVDEAGQPVPAGSVGRLRCRSGAMMREYWLDPERTRLTIDDQGWLTTGDLAFYGEDGNLRITGRLQDMYIRGGYNVYPVQVEEELRQHPEIDDIAILGVPDPVLGEIGIAFVVLAGEASLTLAELREWTAGRTADYKRPDRLEILPAIPRNAMGKVDRRVLAERATLTAAAGAGR